MPLTVEGEQQAVEARGLPETVDFDLVLDLTPAARPPATPQLA